MFGPAGIIAGLTVVTMLPVTMAQTPAAAAATSTVGTVTKLNADARTLSLKTDQNQEFSVGWQANISFRRIAPGETDLKNAANITLDDIHLGDRVLARGKTDNQTVAATLIVVMSQGDVAKKQADEQADWDKRGVTGLVTAISGDSVTINVRTATATKPVVITPDKNAIVRRYAPDSIKFSEAKPSKLGDIQRGDQVRARGDKNADGSQMTATEIVSGAFKTIAGVILSIDAANSEIRVRDLDTKMPVVVKISPDSKMQKVQPALAQMVYQRLHPEAADQVAGGRGQGGGGFGARNGGGDINQMLDASPAMTLAELKNGDAIVVSSTVGTTPGRIAAIKLLAGVEPILTKPGTQEMSLGSWSLSDGGGGGGP